jgi:NDP-sugar pyrophosphorylase family protein
VQVDDPSKYGVVVIDEYGQVQRFVEKPKVCLGAHMKQIQPARAHTANCIT